VLSRVADSVFWMSRYMERAENVARFIDVNYNLTLDLENTMAEQWAPLVFTTGDHQAFASRYPDASREHVLQFLIFDAQNPNSILSCVCRARDNARAVREIISASMWEEINKFYGLVRDATTMRADEDPRGLLHQVRRANHLVMGVTDSTMSHDEAWHIARLGRLIERADKTSRILDVKYFLLLPAPNDVGTPLDIVQWSALLKSASALEMYRRAHGRIVPGKVAEFLILDRVFPRAIRFCLSKAEQSVRAITGTAVESFSNRAEQRIGRLRAQLDYTEIDTIVAGGLHEFIDQLQKELNAIGDAIHQVFFSHLVPTDCAPQKELAQ
jgi:uncharacterized alpha-E superfamily protein